MKFYYDVRHLMRLPLGRSYPTMVHDVGVTLQQPPLDRDAELVIDETGVGRAVGDIFLERGLTPVLVTITAGADAGTMTGNARYSVSKNCPSPASTPSCTPVSCALPRSCARPRRWRRS